MAPLSKKVENAGIAGIRQKRKPNKIQGKHFFEETEAVRKQFAKLINANDPNRIVIIPSVSYGVENALRNLPKKKGKVILAGEQFPSNVYPWLNSDYEVQFIDPPTGPNRASVWSEKILDAINEDTAAVSMGQVHWSDGTLFDLMAIREATAKNNAALIIDGTQSVGALPFDNSEIKADALVCAGYKWLMGPYSIGLAYYGEMFDGGNPIEQNWINRKNSEQFAGLVNYEDQYQSGSLRYEVGEHSNFILLPMLHTSINQVLKWQPAQIQQYCHDLMSEAIEEVSQMGYVVAPADQRASHLFGVRLSDKMNIDKVKQKLKQHRVSISFRGDAMRVAPNIYNDPKDVSRFVRALKEAID